MRQLTVPGYDVWGLLGEGGMSEVWLAKHEVLAVPVIIKTLRRALRASDAQGAAARILSEARLMARVVEPAHRPRARRGSDPRRRRRRTPFLVQEYVDGLDSRGARSPAARVARRRPAALARLPRDA